METDVLVTVALVLGAAIGALLVAAAYIMDLRRIARTLAERDPASNARITRGTGAPATVALIDAVNAELDRASRARVEAVRHQEGFQRDLSALSHDIRTPLSGAKGYLQLALDETDPERARADLQAATERIDATTELLDQLFAYTKSADPDLQLDCVPLALQPLAERVLLAHYPEFEQRGWEPELDVAGGIHAMGDAEAISRILENLVVNALPHGTDSPRIVAGIQETTCLLMVVNPVADPAAIDTERMFTRFYQADRARNAAGSGLGLAVAANLADAMGGSISAAIEGSMLSVKLVLPSVGAPKQDDAA